MRGGLPPGTLAIAQSKSANRKLGACATTYAAQGSCPTSCVFFAGGGCYAESGQLGRFVTAPLNASAGDADELAIARAEAAAIDELEVWAGRPMRLHTVGDCRTEEAARVVAAAAARYIRRGGGPVWTYTHAWRDVPREAWEPVSVLASCETAADMAAASLRGYTPALTVEEFPSRRAFNAYRFDVVPCPAQTTADVTCSSCGLCFNDQALALRGKAIGFAVHGTPLAVKKAVIALRDPERPDRRLTSRDHALAFRREHRRWPSVRELADLADVNESSAWQMLGRLQREAA